MSANYKLQTLWEDLLPMERLIVSVVLQAYRDSKGKIGGSYRPTSLYSSKLDVIVDGQDFFESTRGDGWCAAMGADLEVVMNGIRQIEGR